MSKFSEILINNLKDEPSLEYITSGVWNKLSKKQRRVHHTVFKKAAGIKETKRSLMQYLVTDDFFTAVYADYISQTFEKFGKNNWDMDNKTFTDFKPVTTAEARKHLSDNLSKYNVEVSYPQNTDQYKEVLVMRQKRVEITTNVIGN